MEEKKYTIAEFGKALDQYCKEMEGLVAKAAKGQLKVIGLPKSQHKQAIEKKLNIYRAGLIEIKFAITGILETGKLPSRDDLNAAKEKAGFFVPNQAPKDLGGKSFKTAIDEKVENGGQE